MRVKDKFELVYGRAGDIYNILPLSKSTISAYVISEEDRSHLDGLVKVYSRVKNHNTSKFVIDNMKKVVVTKMDIYPLPAFINKTGTPCVNLSVLASPLLTDYSSSDMYALYLYSLCLNKFAYDNYLPDSIEPHITAYIFSIFIKLFGKKAGLLGAYKELRPKLRFLISLYVHCGMLGHSRTPRLLDKIGSSLYFDPEDIKLDYDFTSTIGFIKSIHGNNIIQLSENNFSTIVINMGGLPSLPLFEDTARFFSTLIASTVSGNSIFTPIWSKINNPLFNKVIYLGLRNLK